MKSFPQFKALSSANRHQFVKGKRLNCLHPDHSSKDCQSKFSCRERNSTTPCSIDLEDLPSQHKLVTTGEFFQASGCSTSHNDTNSKFTTGHLNTDNQTNTVLLSIVVVSVRNASCKPIRQSECEHSWIAGTHPALSLRTWRKSNAFDKK